MCFFSPLLDIQWYFDCDDVWYSEGMQWITSLYCTWKFPYFMIVSDLRQVGGFLRVLRFPPPLYNWNIVESGVKHHKPNQYFMGINVIICFISDVSMVFKLSWE
jgi:hypothetical protein